MWDFVVDLTYNYTQYKAKVSLNDMPKFHFHNFFTIYSVGVVNISQFPSTGKIY